MQLIKSSTLNLTFPSTYCKAKCYIQSVSYQMNVFCNISKEVGDLRGEESLKVNGKAHRFHLQGRRVFSVLR